jgi:FAD/FMN-containing dehydrogenase
MATVVPTGLTEGAMGRALEALVEALGAEAVLTAEADLREFRDPYAFKGSDEYDAGAVVIPTTAEQVQAVVRIANQHRVPLWTFGQGRNNTYGGAAPRVRGSVLVNLRGMNRVLEVNLELAYAVVEPGVRWFDLYDALEAAGGELWPSIPDLGWGSVVGNTLEYGRGYTPYGDHASNVCGMDVVLPSGELLRTGMGAMTNSRAWRVYQRGFGPTADGLFMQSNFGIVTSMGVWLMPRPEVYVAGWARFVGDDKVERFVDTLRRLMLEGTIRNYPIIGQGVGVGADGQPRFEGAGENWALRFALYGPEPVVEAQWRRVEQAFTAIPGVEVSRRTFRGDRTQAENHDERVQGGVPDMDLMDLFELPHGKDTGHLDFSPVTPFTGRDVLGTVRLMRSLYARHGIPYLAGLLTAPRSVIHIGTTFFDTRDEEQTRRAYEAYSDMLAELAKAGHPVYRTNIQHMDEVAGIFDFNDHAQRRFQETIKDALDPNGILSPGKSGIWPKSMRG